MHYILDAGYIGRSDLGEIEEKSQNAQENDRYALIVSDWDSNASTVQPRPIPVNSDTTGKL